MKCLPDESIQRRHVAEGADSVTEAVAADSLSSSDLHMKKRSSNAEINLLNSTGGKSSSSSNKKERKKELLLGAAGSSSTSSTEDVHRIYKAIVTPALTSQESSGERNQQQQQRQQQQQGGGYYANVGYSEPQTATTGLDDDNDDNGVTSKNHHLYDNTLESNEYRHHQQQRNYDDQNVLYDVPRSNKKVLIPTGSSNSNSLSRKSSSSSKEEELQAEINAEEEDDGDRADLSQAREAIYVNELGGDQQQQQQQEYDVPRFNQQPSLSDLIPQEYDVPKIRDSLSTIEEEHQEYDIPRTTQVSSSSSASSSSHLVQAHNLNIVGSVEDLYENQNYAVPKGLGLSSVVQGGSSSPAASSSGNSSHGGSSENNIYANEGRVGGGSFLTEYTAVGTVSVTSSHDDRSSGYRSSSSPSIQSEELYVNESAVASMEDLDSCGSSQKHSSPEPITASSPPNHLHHLSHHHQHSTTRDIAIETTLERPHHFITPSLGVGGSSSSSNSNSNNGSGFGGGLAENKSSVNKSSSSNHNIVFREKDERKKREKEIAREVARERERERAEEIEREIRKKREESNRFQKPVQYFNNKAKEEKNNIFNAKSSKRQPGIPEPPSINTIQFGEEDQQILNERRPTSPEKKYAAPTPPQEGGAEDENGKTATEKKKPTQRDRSVDVYHETVRQRLSRNESKGPSRSSMGKDFFAANSNQFQQEEYDKEEEVFITFEEKKKLIRNDFAKSYHLSNNTLPSSEQQQHSGAEPILLQQHQQQYEGEVENNEKKSKKSTSSMSSSSEEQRKGKKSNSSGDSNNSITSPIPEKTANSNGGQGEDEEEEDLPSVRQLRSRFENGEEAAAATNAGAAAANGAGLGEQQSNNGKKKNKQKKEIEQEEGFLQHLNGAASSKKSATQMFQQRLAQTQQQALQNPNGFLVMSSLTRRGAVAMSKSLHNLTEAVKGNNNNGNSSSSHNNKSKEDSDSSYNRGSDEFGRRKSVIPSVHPDNFKPNRSSSNHSISSSSSSSINHNPLARSTPSRKSTKAPQPPSPPSPSSATLLRRKTVKEPSDEVNIAEIERRNRENEDPDDVNWSAVKFVARMYHLPRLSEDEVLKNSADAAHLEGLLERLPPGKKKSTIWNSWKKQFFVAEKGFLTSYGDNTKSVPLEKIELFGGSVDFVDSKMLGVQDRRGHYLVLKCPSEDQAHKWERALKGHISQDFSKTFVTPSPYPKGGLSIFTRTLVIDIGGSSVRAGVATTMPTLPKLFFPSVMAIEHLNEQAMYFGMDTFAAEVRSRCRLSHPMVPTQKIDTYTIDQIALQGIFEKIFKELNLEPTEFEIQLSVPRTLSDTTKQAIAGMLFEEFGVPSVNMAHQTIFSFYSYNAKSGIMVDLGERMDVIPIMDGYKVQAGVSTSPVGGKELRSKLQHYLLGRNYSLTSFIESFITRYAIEKLTYMSKNFDKELDRYREDHAKIDRVIQIAHPDSPNAPLKSLEMGSERFEACEGLFKPELWGLDQAGIHVLVHKAIKECSMDVRKEMTQSIFLAGGLTLIPGFRARLESELEKLTPVKPRVHASPYRYHAAYLGACVHAVSDAYQNTRVTRGEWFAAGAKLDRYWTM